MLLIVLLTMVAIRPQLVASEFLDAALCRAVCLTKTLPAEETGPESDLCCGRHPDCFLCWEHCGILSKDVQAAADLCQNDNCSAGCQTACDSFKDEREPPKDRLVFPKEPSLSGYTLSWDRVPLARIYSISAVLHNKTMVNIVQTVECKIKLSNYYINRASRIIVVAVNETGAMGITNFNFARNLIKKSPDPELHKIQENSQPNENVERTNFKPTFNQPKLLLTVENNTVIDNTLIRTNISWNFINNNESVHYSNLEYFFNWWIPVLDMEGKAIVPHQLFTEIIYLRKYRCLVKVVALGTEMESQVLTLNFDNNKITLLHTDTNTYYNNLTVILIVNICLLILIVISKLMWAHYKSKSTTQFDIESKSSKSILFI